MWESENQDESPLMTTDNFHGIDRLVLQIQPSGYRSYKLIYRFHKRPRWYHIGAADAIGLADARKLAAELMLRVIKGEDVAAERRAERGSGTFAEIANRYVEEHAKRQQQELETGRCTCASSSGARMGEPER